MTLSGTDTETGVDRMQWQLDGGAINDVGNGDAITISTSGTHTLSTRAVDEAGNASAWRDDTVKVDVTRPNDITDPGTLAWRRTVATFNARRRRRPGLDHIVWKLDNGPEHNDVNGATVTISGDGEHTLSTRGVDVAGNTSLWRDHTIRIDTILPVDDTAALAGWQTAPLP